MRGGKDGNTVGNPNLIEVMKVQPDDIFNMGYKFFNDLVEWKLDLEKERTKKITDLLEGSRIREAFLEILLLSNEGNKYFDDTKPWDLIKTDSEKAKKYGLVTDIQVRPYIKDMSGVNILMVNNPQGLPLSQQSS